MSSSQRKSRGVAAQSQRDRDLREREKERERERAEAAGRRGKRAERRHVDGEHDGVGILDIADDEQNLNRQKSSPVLESHRKLHHQ